MDRVNEAMESQNRDNVIEQDGRLYTKDSDGNWVPIERADNINQK